MNPSDYEQRLRNLEQTNASLKLQLTLLQSQALQLVNQLQFVRQSQGAS